MNLSEVKDRERAVTSLIDAGHPTHEVQVTIDLTPPLDEDQRAALWLLAWAYTDLQPATNAASLALKTNPRG
jgi:hypothetical protein